jgi:hypothetical protein
VDPRSDLETARALTRPNACTVLNLASAWLSWPGRQVSRTRGQGTSQPPAAILCVCNVLVGEEDADVGLRPGHVGGPVSRGLINAFRARVHDARSKALSIYLNFFRAHVTERRLGARDVPAKRVAGGAPITPICAVLGQLVINRPCEQNGGSLRTGRGLPRSLSVIGMLARRVPYRLGAVDNGSAWMGDVVQDRLVMARFPRGLRPEAERQLSGGAIRRAIGRRAMMPSARGLATHFGIGV